MDPPIPMKLQPAITIYAPEGEALNGLGMLLKQYLEQNLAEFEAKARQAFRIRGRVAVEVDKGIAITISFQGERIQIKNGVRDHPDLHLSSSYLLLSKVLSGKANPYLELIRRNIKLQALPRRPYQSIRVLRFLKIPAELLLQPAGSRYKRNIIWAIGAILGLGGLLLLIFQLAELFSK